MLERRFKSAVKRIFQAVGYDIIRHQDAATFPPDFSPSHNSIITTVQPYTMTSPERLYALIEAVRYIVAAEVTGDFVECGVWKGGSMMAAALTLQQLNQTDRQLHLFDTFQGMPKPSDLDRNFRGQLGVDIFEASQTGNDSSAYCQAQLQEVRGALATTGYPRERIHLIRGKVENTIPEQAPGSVALLRLDTDWYESTKHELEHLFPRLSRGGVLIIDDYGHWEGCKRAVDEYFSKNGATTFLARIDYTGRIGIKI